MAVYSTGTVSLEDDLKRVGLRAGAKVVGIAAVEDFYPYVPAGHRPDDFLPGARSVVVAGGDGPSAGAWRSPDHRVIEIGGYDLRENVACHAMADHIEQELGYYAQQAPSLMFHGHEPPMSMQLAAVLAGLGTYSLAARIVLNSDYGLLYYAALITTLPLQPDHPLEEDVCPTKGCVLMYHKIGTTPCIRACPASEGGCLDGSIDQDGKIATWYYDRERCSTRAQNFSSTTFEKQLVQIVNEDDPVRRKSLIYDEQFTRTLSSVAFYKESIAQCFECMRVCPVGRKHRIKK
jgi:epoxyqueuosine reductase QueG